MARDLFKGNEIGKGERCHAEACQLLMEQSHFSQEKGINVKKDEFIPAASLLLI